MGLVTPALLQVPEIGHLDTPFEKEEVCVCFRVALAHAFSVGCSLLWSQSPVKVLSPQQDGSDTGSTASKERGWFLLFNSEQQWTVTKEQCALPLSSCI